jgi:hypothetical protein
VEFSSLSMDGWIVRGRRWCCISRPAKVFDPPPHPPLRLYTNMPIVRKAIFSIFFADAYASDYRVGSGTISSLSRAVVTKDINRPRHSIVAAEAPQI